MKTYSGAAVLLSSIRKLLGLVL
ncbi:Uncharacterized protein OBRU01_26894, partial [Operophtera brumata]